MIKPDMICVPMDALKYIEELEDTVKDLRDACSQKQELINAFNAVDAMRREENYKLLEAFKAVVAEGNQKLQALALTKDQEET